MFRVVESVYDEFISTAHSRSSMKSVADGLPPEIARQVHPDWRKNEVAYWAVRDQLLGQYQGQWIAFADGIVVAAGKRPVTVSHAANKVTQHAFVTCVGFEDRPYRMRRTAFAYDTTYPGEPLPIVRAEFRRHSGTPGILFDEVIVDTGADTTALPLVDCQQLQLNLAQGNPAVMTGMGGGYANTVGFPIWVFLDGNEYECQLHVDFVGNERNIGRDFLNSLVVLFRGPICEIVINP
jgi:hypothetical protein